MTKADLSSLAPLSQPHISTVRLPNSCSLLVPKTSTITLNPRLTLLMSSIYLGFIAI